MTLQISLTPEAEVRLLERAAATGMQPAELARAIVERDVRRPTLEEISGPIHQKFMRSGMSDDELGDLLEDAKHRMREEKSRGQNQ